MHRQNLALMLQAAVEAKQVLLRQAYKQSIEAQAKCKQLQLQLQLQEALDRAQCAHLLSRPISHVMCNGLLHAAKQAATCLKS